MFHISLPFGFGVSLVVCLAAAPLMGENAPYVPYSGIVNGTLGADPVGLIIQNAADASIECAADLAHWYSQGLGKIASGQALEIFLWHDPETGVISLLNPNRDRMPVEALSCGLAGSAHTTRGRITLPLVAGKAPQTLSVTCRMGAKRLECPAD